MAVGWLWLFLERDEPRDACAVARLCLEGEQHVEPDEIGEGGLELGEGLVEGEVGELSGEEAGVEEGCDRGGGEEGAEVPGEGEHVAPEGGGRVEEVEDFLSVAIGASGGERGEPGLGDGLGIGWSDRWKGGNPCVSKSRRWII